MKVFAYNINEIWSLDLAYVDKLAKKSKNLKYLLIEVDCFSGYLRVEPLTSKYATTRADAFRKLIKNKRPKNAWVDAWTEFKESFGTLCQNNEIILYKISARRNWRLPKKYTIDQEFDIQVIRGQMDILVF